MTTPPPDWDEKVRAARTARDGAQSVYEQTVRDAHEIGGRSANSIARALGIKSREQITRYLHATDPAAAPTVKLPLVVYLRGRGRSDECWREMRAGCAARGWYDISDETAAWHIARAGATVVVCDFSAGLRPERVDVRLVAAKYDDDHETWKTLAGHEDWPAPTRHDPVATNNLGTKGAFVLETQGVLRLIAQVSDSS